MLVLLKQEDTDLFLICHNGLVNIPVNMPRQKIIRINAAELNVWRDLADELFKHPLFHECDFDCVEIVSKIRTPDPVIKDIDKHIIRLERLIRNNKNRTVGK